MGQHDLGHMRLEDRAIASARPVARITTRSVGAKL
jgi:hypothetical protein